MNWDAIGAVAEMLGATGVIITLGYLAIQLRQNTRAMRSSTFQQVSVSLSESAQIAAENPHLIRVLLKAESDPEGLNEEETAYFHFMAIVSLRRHETAFVQRRLGAVDESLLRGFTTATLALFASPYWRSWWDQNKQLFLDEFCDWIDGEIRSGKAEPVHFFMKR